MCSVCMGVCGVLGGCVLVRQHVGEGVAFLFIVVWWCVWVQGPLGAPCVRTSWAFSTKDPTGIPSAGYLGLVTVNIPGDFIVLLHWETRSPAP